MKKLFALLAAVAMLAACNDNGEDVATPAAHRLRIEPVITRATEVNFEAGDRIGLKMVSDGVTKADNACLTYAEGVFTGDLNWYAEATTPASLRAYYPYADPAPATFSVQANQSTAAAYTASDLMAAAKDDVLPTAAAVSMVFKHKLSKIILNVTNEAGSSIVSATLKGARREASFDLEQCAATVVESASAADIVMLPVETDKRYAAIVIPQQVALAIEVTLANGATLSQRLASAQLLAGGQYSVVVRVLPQELKVALSGEIENWTDEGTLVPEGSEPSEVAFEDHPDENYFLYDGERYSTVTLSNGQRWMAEPLRYLPQGLTPSTDPTADSHIWAPYTLDCAGSTAAAAQAALPSLDAESVKKNGYLYDMYAALGGQKLTIENYTTFEGAQGICPKGWHIPTRAEYLALCGYSNKTADGQPVTDEQALFWDAAKKYAPVAAYNEAGWNFVMSGVRMKSGYTATPAYQLTRVWSGNSTVTEWYDLPALSYLMTSTAYNHNGTAEALKNIQFFALMTTFTTSAYPEGRTALAYSHVESGLQLRCIAD